MILDYDLNLLVLQLCELSYFFYLKTKKKNFTRVLNIFKKFYAALLYEQKIVYYANEIT